MNTKQTATYRESIWPVVVGKRAHLAGVTHPSGDFEYAVTTEVQFYDSNTGELHTKNTQYRREKFAALPT